MTYSVFNILVGEISSHLLLIHFSFKPLCVPHIQNSNWIWKCSKAFFFLTYLQLHYFFSIFNTRSSKIYLINRQTFHTNISYIRHSPYSYKSPFITVLYAATQQLDVKRVLALPLTDKSVQ